MKSYRETILPGVGLSQRLGGRMFYIQRCSAGPVLTIDLYRGGDVQTVENVGKGFKAEPVGGFDAFRIRTTAESVVDFVIADGNVQVQFDEETTVGNTDGQAIPIRTPVGEPLEVLFAGVVSPVLGVVTVDNSNAEAIPVQSQALAIIVDHVAAVINVGAAQLLVSDATYKRLRVKNAHATARVAIGGVAVTLANAAIILEPGDLWIENDAAGAAWYATSDTAAADVRVMGLKA